MFWLDLCNLWRQPCFQCRLQPLPNNIYSTIPSTYIALQTAWCVQWTLQLPVINGSGTFFSLTYSLASLSPKAAPVCLQVFEGTLSNPLLFFLLSCSSTFLTPFRSMPEKTLLTLQTAVKLGVPYLGLGPGHPKKCMLFLEFNCNLRYFWKPHYFE